MSDMEIHHKTRRLFKSVCLSSQYLFSLYAFPFPPVGLMLLPFYLNSTTVNSIDHCTWLVFGL